VANQEILLVSHSAALGGAELFLVDLAKAIPPSRVCLFEHGPLEERLSNAQVPFVVLKAGERLRGVRRDSGIRSVIGSIGAVFALVRSLLAVARDGEILFANSQKSLVVCSIACMLRRCRLTWHLHDILSSQHFGRLQRSTSIILSNLTATDVSANSDAAASAYRIGGGVHTPIPLYNIVSVPSTEEDPALPANLRRDQPIIGSFSRFAAWKGVDVAVTAMASVPNAQLILVGGALFEGDRPYAEVLRAQIRASGQAHRIFELGFRSDISDLMRICDVIVHASRSPEPFGRVIAEALALGVPVIASRGGGTGEIIEHGETGWLLEPGDPEALAETMRYALGNVGHARRMAEAGRERVLDRYSRDRLLEQIRMLFK
jgi:glycosyltransferase involved in cell wall biosynthesis